MPAESVSFYFLRRHTNAELMQIETVLKARPDKTFYTCSYCARIIKGPTKTVTLALFYIFYIPHGFFFKSTATEEENGSLVPTLTSKPLALPMQ